MLEFRLTTFDNPFNPFDEFDLWFAFDENSGYHSSSLLASVLETSSDLPESFQNSDIEQAIDDIIREDPFLMYRKVSQERPARTVPV